jgi:hypothetical protein
MIYYRIKLITIKFQTFFIKILIISNLIKIWIELNVNLNINKCLNIIDIIKIFADKSTI